MLKILAPCILPLLVSDSIEKKEDYQWSKMVMQSLFIQIIFIKSNT